MERLTQMMLENNTEVDHNKILVFLNVLSKPYYAWMQYQLNVVKQIGQLHF